MGYYVTLINADFVISPEAEPFALQAMKDLNKRDDLKRGGSYSGGRQTAKWFSWMPENYDQDVSSTKDVFRLLGFDVEVDEDGTRLNEYESKIGQEELFLEACAPFVKVGSFVEWEGEDGARWRHVVGRNGVLTSQHARVEVIWDAPLEENLVDIGAVDVTIVPAKQITG